MRVKILLNNQLKTEVSWASLILTKEFLIGSHFSSTDYKTQMFFDQRSRFKNKIAFIAGKAPVPRILCSNRPNIKTKNLIQISEQSDASAGNLETGNMRYLWKGEPNTQAISVLKLFLLLSVSQECFHN